MSFDRSIIGWSVIQKPSNDGVTKIYALKGIVVTDTKPLPKEVVRLTVTSPIRSLEGKTITTCSGSNYLLLRPSQVYLQTLGIDLTDDMFSLDYWTAERIQALFQPEHLNPWVNGDNWLTI